MKMPQNNPIENCYNYEDSPFITESINNANENGGNNGVEDYQTPPPGENEFEEYLWMENEEEFDKEVMQRLEEEALMEQCIAAMLEDEEFSETVSLNNINRSLNGVSHAETNEVSSLVNNLKLDSTEAAKTSTLNPLAAEFVPASRLKSASP